MELSTTKKCTFKTSQRSLFSFYFKACFGIFIPILALFITPIRGNGLQDLVDSMRRVDYDRPTKYTVNWGTQCDKNDLCRSPPLAPLYTTVDEALFQKPQYAALIKLYNSGCYEGNICIEESPITGEKKQLIEDVFNAFINTSVFNLAFRYLQNMGKAGSFSEFRSYLWTLWFQPYSRYPGVDGSSGFEHVFLGEFREAHVEGLHTWSRYYMLQKANEIKYYGYYNHHRDQFGAFQFRWNKYLKKKGSFLLNTSPAFDFALYTVCALTKPGNQDCTFKMDGYNITIVSCTLDCGNGHTCIGTAYPVGKPSSTFSSLLPSLMILSVLVVLRLWL